MRLCIYITQFVKNMPVVGSFLFSFPPTTLPVIPIKSLPKVHVNYVVIKNRLLSVAHWIFYNLKLLYGIGYELLLKGVKGKENNR